MKIDTLGILAFVAVAEHGRFQKAADSLHITQTALTRRLQNLERSLGVTLVERTTRSTGLTQIGREFLPQAQRPLADLATALTEIRESARRCAATCRLPAFRRSASTGCRACCSATRRCIRATGSAFST